MSNYNDTSQMGIPNRDELLHLVQQYEAEFVHSMPADKLQQTEYVSEHELISDVMNSVSLQSTPAIWDHYGALVDGFGSNDQEQGGTS